MGTRINRYYNNPEIGAAISNLASIFEPPAPTDVLAYAQAAKVRGESDRLADVWSKATTPGYDQDALDRALVGSGMITPSQSYYAVDTRDATDRYGIGVASGDRRYGVDVGAATARATNAADNANALREAQIRARGGIVGDLLAPVPEDALRTGVSSDIMGALGFPEVALPGAAGPRSPLSESEVEGELLLDAVREGLYTPEDVAAAQRSEINVEEVLDPQGNPTIVGRGDAIGKEPFVQPGSAPASDFVVYRTPAGQTGTAVQNRADGTMVDQATRQPLPQGTEFRSGANPNAGEITTGVQSDFQKRAFALTGALSTIDHLTTLISSSPSSQGLVGSIRGTAQDIMQTGNELGRAFGGTMAEVQDAVAKGLVDANIASQMYDPNIPAIDMLSNVLAWQYAKSMSGDRVSNEMLASAKRAIGDGSVWGNQANSLARLGQLRKMLSEEGGRLLPHLEGTMAGDLDLRLRVAPPPPGDVPNAGGPQRISTDEEFMALPPGTEFVDPQGNVRRKP